MDTPPIKNLRDFRDAQTPLIKIFYFLIVLSLSQLPLLFLAERVTMLIAILIYAICPIIIGAAALIGFYAAYLAKGNRRFASLFAGLALVFSALLSLLKIYFAWQLIPQGEQINHPLVKTCWVLIYLCVFVALTFYLDWWRSSRLIVRRRLLLVVITTGCVALEILPIALLFLQWSEKINQNFPFLALDLFLFLATIFVIVRHGLYNRLLGTLVIFSVICLLIADIMLVSLTSVGVSPLKLLVLLPLYALQSLIFACAIYVGNTNRSEKRVKTTTINPLKKILLGNFIPLTSLLLAFTLADFIKNLSHLYLLILIIVVILHEISVIYDYHLVLVSLHEAKMAADKAQQLAEEADRYKTQFISKMSHELRTPLNTVINYTYRLRQHEELYGPLTEKQRFFLACVQEDGEHLLNFINDVLDLAKIEAGRMELSFVTTDLRPLCEAVIATATGLIGAKDLTISLDIPPHLPFIEVDPLRLRQVLINLLSNAVKFSESGTITLSIKELDRSLLISVCDMGIGIAAYDQQSIFDDFFQAENHRNTGTGLGLPISKKLIELHGGTMSLVSIPGVGSTFSFDLPVRHFEV